MELNSKLQQETSTSQDTIEKNKKNPIWEIIQFILVVGILAVLIHSFVVEQVVVSGESMEDTLYNEDRLLVEKCSYYFSEPKRFDIIVFHPQYTTDEIYYIKRIIGLPGETVQIKKNDIYINGKILEENYGKEEMISAGLAKTKITLGENEFFVLGDNRNNSKDSRNAEVSIVKKDSILGRAFIRIWPITKLGMLKHQ